MFLIYKNLLKTKSGIFLFILILFSFCHSFSEENKYLIIQTTDLASAFASPEYRVCKNNDEFKTLWDRLQKNIVPPEPLPEVNWNNHIVIGIFAGTQPSMGYEIKIDRIIEVDDALRIFFTLVEPDPDDMPPAIITFPNIVFKIDRTEKPVEFWKNKKDEGFIRVKRIGEGPEKIFLKDIIANSNFYIGKEILLEGVIMVVKTPVEKAFITDALGNALMLESARKLDFSSWFFLNNKEVLLDGILSKEKENLIFKVYNLIKPELGISEENSDTLFKEIPEKAGTKEKSPALEPSITQWQELSEKIEISKEIDIKKASKFIEVIPETSQVDTFKKKIEEEQWLELKVENDSLNVKDTFIKKDTISKFEGIKVKKRQYQWYELHTVSFLKRIETESTDSKVSIKMEIEPEDTFLSYPEVTLTTVYDTSIKIKFDAQEIIEPGIGLYRLIINVKGLQIADDFKDYELISYPPATYILTLKSSPDNIILIGLNQPVSSSFRWEKHNLIITLVPESSLKWFEIPEEESFDSTESIQKDIKYIEKEIPDTQESHLNKLSILKTKPENNQENIPIYSDITIVFSSPLDTVNFSNENIILEYESPQTEYLINPLSVFSIYFQKQGSVLVIDPYEFFDHNSKIKVFLSKEITSVDGIKLGETYPDGYSFSFITEK